MKLKDLFELPTKIDEDIHQGYSKLTKRWEDKGRSKYSLSGLCDGASAFSESLHLFLSPESFYVFPALVNGLSLGNSIMGRIEGEHPTGIKKENGRFIVDDKFFYFIDNFGKTIRASELILGTSLIGKGIFDFYNYFANNDSSSLSEGLSNLGSGVSLVSNASAWYIRDSDPKVLDKKPNWKAGLEMLIDYVSPKKEPSEIKIPVKY